MIIIKFSFCILCPIFARFLLAYSTFFGLLFRFLALLVGLYVNIIVHKICFLFINRSLFIRLAKKQKSRANTRGIRTAPFSFSILNSKNYLAAFHSLYCFSISALISSRPAAFRSEMYWGRAVEGSTAPVSIERFIASWTLFTAAH